MAACNLWMLALGMIFGVTLALPLEKTNESRVKRSGSEVADIEAQLLQLADKASRTGGGVEFEKSQVSSVHSQNGKTKVHQVKDNKVLHPQTGKTVAEVQQETEGYKDSPSDDMHQQTKTEVDVPEQGLHREWSEQDQGEKQQPRVDWTANVGVDDVAAYLLQSGDFDGYFSAVEGLVDVGTISADRARDYSRQVGAVYRKLQESQQQDLGEEHAPEEDTEEAPEEQAAKAVVAAEKKSQINKIPIAEEEEEEEKGKQEQTAPAEVPAEEQDAYVQAMKTTIKRLFKQALIDGDRAAERTLREFIAYVTNLAESGELPVTEVQELLGMMTAAMEEQILSQEETQGAPQQGPHKTQEEGKPVEIEEEKEPEKKPQEED